ncbi:hypothetical protein BpHYR1_045540 [Brachionus plicatilis]|uniref:Uncharacterized protein n=1 Tax=Brachionus plicatilis TaxID=10195 RepID=A0A3M7SXW1_BRAPC|nr:hypothetical protein BpHYR1_045540 [Brachionus plicatilis]
MIKNNNGAGLKIELDSTGQIFGVYKLPYSLVRYCSLRIRNTTLTQAINTISPIINNRFFNGCIGRTILGLLSKLKEALLEQTQ